MKHHNFQGICKNCGHDGQDHYGYFYDKVICWDVLGNCNCSVFEKGKPKEEKFIFPVIEPREDGSIIIYDMEAILQDKIKKENARKTRQEKI